MSRIAMSLVVVLLALHASHAVAQECLSNVAVPKTVTVSYDDALPESAVRFQPGADGVLRAFEVRGGRELWRFTPPELDLTYRADGLMSELRVLRFDSDLDGVLEPAAGDRLWLYFGMRRGGHYYYALDATDREHPRVLWRAGPDELPGVGETWSAPVIARVRVGGASQNREQLVVIVGGGYDETSTSGHRLYMLDAATGDLLWYAAGPGGVELPSSPDLALARMTNPVAARVAALDLDGDRYADRLYAADIGGRIWRLDVWNGQPAAQLVTGGVLASLGAAESASPGEARRFFSGPDVAFVWKRGVSPHYNLAIGSGDRARLFGSDTHDRLYSLRDRQPFAKLTQSAYEALPPILDRDLIDVTDFPMTATVSPAAAGWKLELRSGGRWLGEKALAEPLTVNGVVFYTTFEPAPGSDCADSGRNRVYALRLEQGRPALDVDDDGRIDEHDVAADLEQHGIAGSVELRKPGGAGQADDPPDDDPDDPSQARVRCAVGAEGLRFCAPLQRVRRTFWQRNPPPD